MNPDTNRFEELREREQLPLMEKRISVPSDLLALDRKLARLSLLRPDGSPVPEHWSIFQIGENVVIKDYTFKVSYIGETAILFEPVGPAVIEESNA